MTTILVRTRLRALRVAGLTLVAIVATGVLALGMGVSPASAHAQLLDSNPEDGSVLLTAPNTAELEFNEPVRVMEHGIRLFTSDGSAPIALTTEVIGKLVIAQLPVSLTEGSYAISYRVISADGHPVTGAISFSVGDNTPAIVRPEVPDAATPPATELSVAIFTGLQYLGVLGFAGLVMFYGLVIRRQDITYFAARKLVRLFFAMGLLASIGLIPLSAMRATGTSLVELFRLDAWIDGLSWAPILVTCQFALAGWILLALKGRSPDFTGTHVLSSALSGVAAVAPLWVGHSQAFEAAWIMLPADALHVISAAFWVGGAIGLLQLLRAGAQGFQGALIRFASLALLNVSLLIASGTAMAMLVLADWQALLETTYGRLLLVKLGVAGSAMFLAVWIRTRLLPRPEKSASADVRRARFSRILSYEGALLISILVLTGLLTNTSPSHTHHHALIESQNRSGEVPVDRSSQGLRVVGLVSFEQDGGVLFTFELEYDGAPVRPEWVRLETRLSELELGPFQVVPQLADATGSYRAYIQLPVAGEWVLQVSARISQFSMPTVLVPISIR